MAGGHDLLVPDLLPVEAGNVIWKKVRRRELSALEGHRALASLTLSPVQIRPSAPLVLVAFDVAILVGRTVYDSLYLVLALQNQVKLITADQRFHNAVQASLYATHCLLLSSVDPSTL